MNILYDKHLEAIENQVYVAVRDYGDFVGNKKEAAKSCAEITESIACEFAEWTMMNYYDFYSEENMWYSLYSVIKKCTTQELFKLFIESKTK